MQCYTDSSEEWLYENEYAREMLSTIKNKFSYTVEKNDIPKIKTWTSMQECYKFLSIWVYLFHFPISFNTKQSLSLIFRVFLSHKINSRRSAHSPLFKLMIILIISWQIWLMRLLTRNPDCSWWHGHTSIKLFWSQLMAL